MRGRIVDFALSMTGKQRVTFEVDEDFRAKFDALHENDIDLTVKRFRQRRSLDANAYAWVLIDKLAERMKLPKEVVYRDHIRALGGVSETVCVQDRAVDRLIQAWGKNGLGWQTETFPSKIAGCTNVTLYYGSSTYDTAQMNGLIDALVQSCKAIGIETMPQEQLDSLMRSYE
jgi:hypothetical protein